MNIKMPITRQDYKKFIKYDLITFDMFDTLVSRKIYEPDDILKLVSIKIGNLYCLKPLKFLKSFKKAEKWFMKKYNCEVELDRILNYIKNKNNFSDKIINSAKKYLIKYELEFIYPIKEIQNLFNYLNKKNKKIFIVSDMYHSRATLEMLLKKCGYINIPEILVSCEQHKNKYSGELWKDFFKNKEKIKTLHIGNDYKSDAEFFIHNNKDYILLNTKHPFSLMMQDYKGDISIYDSISLGLIKYNLFCKNNYNSSTNPIKTCFDFGYSVLGPIFLGFFTKLQKILENKNIIFVSRDGYYLQKMYKSFIKYSTNELENNNIYFYASRQTSDLLNIKKPKDVYKIVKKTNFIGTSCEFLMSRFNIESKTINSNKNSDIKERLNICQKYMNQILYSCHLFRTRYDNYLKQNVDNRSIIVDLGYQGTIQYNISKYLRLKIPGFYILTWEKIKKCKKYGYIDCFPIKGKKLRKQYTEPFWSIMESFLTAPHGQFCNIDETGKPMFKHDALSNSLIKKRDKILNGITNYFKDMSLYNDMSISKIFNTDIIGYNALLMFFNLAKNGSISYELCNAFVSNNIYTGDNTKRWFKQSK